MQDQDVYEALASLGPRIGTGVYDQGARLTAFGYTNPEVQNGYCQSACLDWARRVVQAGRTSFEPSANNKTGEARTAEEKRAKEEAQTDRAVNIHLNFKLGNLNIGTPWQNLRESLDQNYLGAKGRKFGQINQIYYQSSLNLGSVTSVVGHLTSQTGFTTNCCALLGFRYIGGGGHVVAVYQTNTSKFILFDPNYTMFEYANIDKLYDALRYLFLDAVYPYQDKAWNGTLNMFVYSGTVAASNPTVVVQTISPTLHAVETTSVLSPPIPTTPIPVATVSAPTVSLSGPTLHAPTAGATQFKQNLWQMLNEEARKDGEYVKIAYSQKSAIEQKGGTVTQGSGGYRVPRQQLVGIYNNVT